MLVVLEDVTNGIGGQAEYRADGEVVVPGDHHQGLTDPEQGDYRGPRHQLLEARHRDEAVVVDRREDDDDHQDEKNADRTYSTKRSTSQFERWALSSPGSWAPGAWWRRS